ncbi:MAG TPA: glycoside hydrolase family 15 protein [Chloroflexia bacterium]|nr:glycoside hydrolase family 15 protein [Chloroflexia bacterium]
MHHLYSRSIELIRANQAPNGAYVASPNFGEYAYCWFRDGTYIAYSMDLVGEHAGAARFYGWATDMVASRRAQVERAVEAARRGNLPQPEDLLHTRYALDGQASEGDWPNFQLDGFGTLLWGIAEHVSISSRPMPGEWRGAVDLLARYLAALWRFPCYDCWEEFGDKIHTSTLAALYGGLNAATSLLGDATHARAAEEIKRFALDNCVLDGTLCKFVGSKAVDSNLVHVATPYRLLSPGHPVMVATIERIERELRQAGGGAHRYADDSYYGGGEWVLLTAYLGWYYIERGQVSRALDLLRWIEDRAGADCMLPEQVAEHLNHPDMLPVWEERWGPSARPLLWSHAAYLTLSEHLRRASDAG